MLADVSVAVVVGSRPPAKPTEVGPEAPFRDLQQHTQQTWQDQLQRLATIATQGPASRLAKAEQAFGQRYVPEAVWWGRGKAVQAMRAARGSEGASE